MSSISLLLGELGLPGWVIPSGRAGPGNSPRSPPGLTYSVSGISSSSSSVTVISAIGSGCSVFVSAVTKFRGSNSRANLRSVPTGSSPGISSHIGPDARMLPGRGSVRRNRPRPLSAIDRTKSWRTFIPGSVRRPPPAVRSLRALSRHARHSGLQMPCSVISSSICLVVNIVAIFLDLSLVAREMKKARAQLLTERGPALRFLFRSCTLPGIPGLREPFEREVRNLPGTRAEWHSRLHGVKPPARSPAPRTVKRKSLWFSTSEMVAVRLGTPPYHDHFKQRRQWA